MRLSEALVEALLREDGHVSTGPARKELERKAWAAQHRDYKGKGADGVRRMLHRNPKTGGTESWPIEQIPDADLESLARMYDRKKAAGQVSS